MNNTRISISPSSIIIFLALILAILFIYQIRDVLLFLFASFVIASALLPSVDWLSKKIPRAIVVFFVFVVGIILILTILIPFISIIMTQGREFIDKMPLYWDNLVYFFKELRIFAASNGFPQDYSGIITGASQLGQGILDKTINFTVNLFAGITGVFTLAVVVLFILLDKKELGLGYIKIFPPKYRQRAKDITVTISKKVGGYVRGQVILMLAVGVLTAVGLQIIGMEFALLLGIIAGLLEIIPIIGPILSAVPAVIIAFSHDPLLALWVLLVYIVVQRLENHILTPMILGSFLEMHPMIIIIAILVAASTLGLFGVILSPAIAAALYVLFDELYLKKIENNSF